MSASEQPLPRINLPSRRLKKKWSCKRSRETSKQSQCNVLRRTKMSRFSWELQALRLAVVSRATLPVPAMRRDLRFRHDIEIL
ncbi:hypothetical protein AVEN_37002-1 [Araneus ventricosus]|uniref:Uncharacterized protein n=1 Tax=Araneus ventricosus TaxID=182803 RepID=A0A4Y2KVH5_ARAVE|nr:hypothetical protein AVEN_37002-1 [Araneus ventricosus]